MELKIVLEQDDYRKGIVHLKEQLDKSAIDGVEKNEVDRKKGDKNEMGVGDILNQIASSIP